MKDQQVFKKEDGNRFPAQIDMGLRVVITGFSIIELNRYGLLLTIGEEDTVDTIPMGGQQTCCGFHDGPFVQVPDILNLEQIGIDKCRYFGLPDIKGAAETGK